MTALPIPEGGGTIDLLKPFLNLRADDDFRLVVAWTLAALRASRPVSGPWYCPENMGQQKRRSWW